ncbi:MAG: hypothetical protein ACK5NN_14160 [Sphingomonadaceae bacterium]
MTNPAEPGLWHQLQSGNPWWPSYHPRQDDVLSWRHAAAILLRDVDPIPIFAKLPDLFEAIYDQTANAVCERFPSVDGRLTWKLWFCVWRELPFLGVHLTRMINGTVWPQGFARPCQQGDRCCAG